MEKYPLQNTNITLVKHSLTSFILLCIALTIHQDVDVLLLHGSNFASLLAFLIWKCYLEHYEIYSVRLVGIFLSIMELLAVLQRKKIPCSGLLAHVVLLVVFGENLEIDSVVCMSGVWT